VGFAQAHPIVALHWLEFASFLLTGIAVPLNLRLARKYQSRIALWIGPRRVYDFVIQRIWNVMRSERTHRLAMASAIDWRSPKDIAGDGMGAASRAPENAESPLTSQRTMRALHATMGEHRPGRHIHRFDHVKEGAMEFRAEVFTGEYKGTVSSDGRSFTALSQGARRLWRASPRRRRLSETSKSQPASKIRLRWWS